MVSLAVLFQVIACACFLGAALGLTARVNLVALGLALFMLSVLIV